MRSLFALTFALMVAASPTLAQTPPSQPAPQQPQTQPATPPAQPQGRVFGSDAGLVFNQIKADKTADFEMVMAKLKEALQKSQDPTRKQQAASWKVFRAQEAMGGNVLYVFVLDPVVKGADYTVSKILAEVFPSEVQALYKTFSEAYAPNTGQSLVNLTVVQNFTVP